MRYVLDSRIVRPGDCFVALEGEKVDGRKFIPAARAAGAAKIIEGLDELQAAARQYRRAMSATVVGVTGSAGKTTTKEFLKTFLNCYGTEGNFNNHIGLPLTILNCPENAEFLVVEMGMNHPGEIAALCEIAQPDVGVISSIGSAHIEFFGSTAAIAQEKGSLFAATKKFNVVPENCAEIEVLRRCSGATELLVAPDADLPCPLPGAHYRADMSVAAAVAARLGVDNAAMRQRLDTFALPGGRWRRVVRDGINFIDDTYNANPDAMIAALKTLAELPVPGRRIAILGDMFELGEQSGALHRRVFDFAHELPLDLVIAVGETSATCRCSAGFTSVAELKRQLPNLLAVGDTVLLKASHSMNLGGVLS